MKDKLTKRERSDLMAKVRGRGNESTELALVKLFRQNKIIGWRRQINLRFANDDSRRPRTAGKNRKSKIASRKFAVRPDFVFPKLKLALFVDGCFWHGCPKHGTQPKGNRVFWKNKFARNRARDALVTRTLHRAGWRVLRIWEHELALRREARLLRRIWRTLAPARKIFKK
jgi:DNA mismatch endonuclease (patch repair protein)